jgi:hypothetical protein
MSHYTMTIITNEDRVNLVSQKLRIEGILDTFIVLKLLYLKRRKIADCSLIIANCLVFL